MDYGGILSKAWQIIWKHKVLWIFGILAGCSQAGGSGGSNSGFRFSGGQGPSSIPGNFDNFFNNLNMPEGLVALLVIAAILLVLVFIVIAIVLGTVGRVGLIRGASQVDQGSDRLIFGELFSGSMRYFWRVFGLNLLVGIALIILVPLVGIPLAIITCGLGAIALVIVLLLLPVYLQQAIIAIVLEDLGVMDGLRRGWQIFRANLVTMIVMGLILFVFSLVAGLIFAVPLTLLLAPIIAGALAGERMLAGGFLVAGLCFIGYLPILLLLSGILRSYTESAWTLTFRRLTQPPVIVEAVPAPAQI